MKRTKYETETSISMNDEDAEAMLWTCQAPMLRKMEKLGLKPYRSNGDEKAFMVPKKWISVRPPKVMTLSEDQRNAIRERLKINSKKL